MAESSSDDEWDDWPVERDGASGRSPGHFAILLALLLSTAAIVFVAIKLEPDPRGFGTHEQLGFAPCSMLESTGIPCPACGITTAVTLSTQGNLWEGALTQPMGPLLVILVPLLTALALIMHAIGKDVYALYRNRTIPWVRVGFIVSLLAWIYRMGAWS
jgi:hypothetical protein